MSLTRRPFGTEPKSSIVCLSRDLLGSQCLVFLADGRPGRLVAVPDPVAAPDPAAFLAFFSLPAVSDP